MDEQEESLLIIDEKEKALYYKLWECFRCGYAEAEIPLVHLAVDCGVNYRDAQGIFESALSDAWEVGEIDNDDPDPHNEDVYFFEDDDDVLVYGEDPDDFYDGSVEGEIDRKADLMAHGRL